mmetsp:Transcript_12769/g.19325  ORF Transcript_12769/g.19325 Transcript_12769/m.19325 type:complete len:357 (-) Transcript_12769:206-1276(-)
MRDGTVIVSGHALADGRFHKTRERREHIDWRVDLSVVDLTIDVNLSLCDVTGQIRNWMCNIIIWHSEDRDLCDGTVTALNTTSTLVDGGKIGVHITWITTTARHLFTGSRHLTQRIGIRRHICKEHKHMLFGLIGEILGSGKGKTGSDDTLDGWIVGQVEKQGDTLEGTVLFEILLEKARSFHIHTHGSKHDGKIVFVVVNHTSLFQFDQTCLATDLRCNLIVWQTSRREKRDLLTTRNGVHRINGRDTSLDHFFRIHTRVRVDWLTHNIQIILSKYTRALVDWLSRPVENASQHVLGHWNLENVARKLTTRVTRIDARRSFKHLHNRLLARHFEHLALAYRAITECEIHNLGKFR